MKIKPDGNDKCPFCGFDNSKYMVPANHLPPMTPLNGKYILGKAKGQGGFGITYIAYDLHLETKVAIKELFLKQISSRQGRNVVVEEGKQSIFEENKKRFLQEARVLARFNEKKNEGIVTVKEHFEENNTAYIVMEYLDGVNLRDFIRDNGPISMSRVIEMFGPVFQTLAKVHQFGIIHKDISPDNIMLLDDGRTKLLDFGGAQSIYSEEVDDIVSFKKGYAPPEQYEEKGRIGQWTDVYALGATIYYCITGVKPADAKKRLNSLDEIRKPSELGVKIPKAVENAIFKALELDPMKRFESVEDFWNAINITKKPNRLPLIIAGVAIVCLAFAINNLLNNGSTGRTEESTVQQEAQQDLSPNEESKTESEITLKSIATQEETAESSFDKYEIGDIIPIEYGTYIFENAADPDHLVMGIDSNFSDDGACLLLKEYQDINCNRFYLEKGNGEAYLMHAAHTDSFIEPQDFENVESLMVQHSGNGANNYNFTFVFCGYNEERDEVEVMIQNADGYILQPVGDEVGPGINVGLGEKDFDDDSNKWYVRWSEVDQGEPKVVVRKEGDMVEDIDGFINLASAMDGITMWSVSSYGELEEPEIIVWEQVWDDTQKFVFELKEESRYRIYPVSQEKEREKCLEYDESTSKLIIRNVDEENSNQLFRVIYAGYNMYLIQAYNEMVLGYELKDDGTWQGMPLKAKLYSDYEDSKQVKWLLKSSED